LTRFDKIPEKFLISLEDSNFCENFLKLMRKWPYFYLFGKLHSEKRKKLENGAKSLTSQWFWS